MTKKIISLSVMLSSVLLASEIQLQNIDVESTVITEVSENAQVSADLGEALSISVPSVDLSRRSGIANDVLIRGQKRDNISVSVDGTKVMGACPNRMDPPISHIITNQIDDIEVIEGPYDVENFGTLSGGIKIKTKKPKKGLNAELNFGYGAWNYLKVGAGVSGGNDTIRLLITASTESSDQYKDGNGDTFADQIQNNADANPTDATAQGSVFQDKYRDMQAYTKSSLMTKAFVNITENQELRLSYTANRSDDIVYANSKMDAMYDDSNIYSVEYNVNKLSDAYKNLNIQYYASDVDHPMATKYRVSALNPMMDNTNHLTTDMKGLKLKNSFEIASYKLLVGLDGSQRNWDGNYYNTTTKAAKGKSIDDAQTDNIAIFTKLDKSFDALNLSFGLRYDSTEITHATLESNDYTAFSANIMSRYKLNDENKIFFGFGQASRVPDARELYFRAVSNTGTDTVGTNNLDQTTNTELDLGYELQAEMISLKIKAFYSMLDNYIYIQKGLAVNAFSNVDATIYGGELTSSYFATDELTFDLALSYKVGERDTPLANQSGTNLADMAPLRGNLSVSYEYMKDSVASMNLRASDTWDKIDAENGEQVLASWTAIDMKVKHRFNKMFDFAVGVNNLLDETYAQSNTYADLTLVTAGTSDVMLVNEPGRYIYTNLNVKF